MHVLEHCTSTTASGTGKVSIEFQSQVSKTSIGLPVVFVAGIADGGGNIEVRNLKITKALQ